MIRFFQTLVLFFFSSQILFAASLPAPQINISVSGTIISISWNKIESASGYNLFYAPYPYIGAETITSVDLKTKLEFSATLTNGAAYYVAVKAYNNMQSSDYSNIELFQISDNQINLPTNLTMLDIPAGTFVMGNNNLAGPQSGQATEHDVTLSAFQMSATEISNTQYIDFLNAALSKGLIKLELATTGADSGMNLIVGTDSSTYAGCNLSLFQLASEVPIPS